MHEDTPKVVAMAVSTVMMMLRIFPASAYREHGARDGAWPSPEGIRMTESNRKCEKSSFIRIVFLGKLHLLCN